MENIITISDIYFEGKPAISNPTVYVYFVVTDKLRKRFDLPTNGNITSSVLVAYNPFIKEVSVRVAHSDGVVDEPALQEDERADVLEALKEYCKGKTGQSLHEFSRKVEVNGFYVCNEAYYFNPAFGFNPASGQTPEIMIGHYVFENGSDYEFALEFGNIAPRIKLYNDSWNAFTEMPGVFALFARLNKKPLSQSEAIEELKKVGLIDITQRELPEGSKQEF